MNTQNVKSLAYHPRTQAWVNLSREEVREGFIKRQTTWHLDKLKERPNEILDLISEEEQRELSGEIIDALMNHHNTKNPMHWSNYRDAVVLITNKNKEVAERLANKEADERGL